MRKFLAALLAVFMLAAVAVLPIAAESTAVTKSDFDGTTIADAEALGLVVTEYMSNTTCSVSAGTTDVHSQDAFQYIEVYNRGNADVNLYDLAVVRGKNMLNSDPWNANAKFEAKMALNPGSIYQNVPGVTGNITYTKHACVNPGTAIVKPGEFAIIWFWNDASRTVSDAAGKSLGRDIVDPNTGKTIYHSEFRKHYNTQNSDVQISNDLLIVAVYAGSSTDSANNPRFSLNTSSSYMYALVKDETFAGGTQFDLADPAVEVNRGQITTYEYNPAIVCLWQWGVLTNLSIPSITPEGVATAYVPANNVPDYYNASEKAIDDEFVNKNNFYESGYVDGFKEVGLVGFEEKPTIGAMEAWQWAYVDPARAPESVTGGDTTGAWMTTAKQAYLTANVKAGTADVENPEVDRHPDGIHVDRNQLGNLGSNIDPNATTATEDSGLPTWALILIIVGGVVVLGGVAVVLIVVLKKKNKPVALDDVSNGAAAPVFDENGMLINGEAAQAPAAEQNDNAQQ